MKKQLLTIGALSVLALAGCGSSTTSTTTTASSSATPDAEKIVQQSCISCHGNNLEGSVGPNLTKIGSELSKDQILDILKNGKSGGMPAGLITGADAEAVAQYLSQKK